MTWTHEPGTCGVPPTEENIFNPPGTIGVIWKANDAAMESKKAFFVWNGRLFAATAGGPVHLCLATDVEGINHG